MDAYNYNLILGELCLLPNKNLDSNFVPEPEQVIPEPEQVIPEPEPVIQKLEPTKKVFNSTNYNIVEPLKLLKAPAKKRAYVMQGGNPNLDYNQINNLIYNNPEHLSVITKFYYDNYGQIMNSNQIINVLISFIYNEFTDPDVTKELETIITPEYIDTIPEMYVFNFHDKVMGDLIKVCPDINEKFKLLDENIDLLVNPTFLQKGGKKTNKRIDISNDKTVEEKIKNNINILSTFLKSKRTKNLSQKGGSVTLPEMMNEILRFNALSADERKNKSRIREMQEISNTWVVELLEEKLVSKIIKDDEYNIARYYLQKNDNATDPNIKDIITFVNANASILTLKDADRIKIDIPNKLDSVSKYGKSKPTRITEKLKEYFDKKYEELLKLRDLSKSKKTEEPTDPIQKLALVISEFKTQTGGQEKTIRLEKKLEDTFEEKCFTSKQLGIFLRKAAGYLKLQNKKLDEDEITRIQEDMKKIEEIEKNLIKNYKIFDNYVKIQQAYPNTSKKVITIDHMKKVFDDNQQLFDNYGNINKDLFGQIETLEKYLNLKEEEDNKELNSLYGYQTGGKNFNTNKSYLKFNTQNDIEHFTSRSFQKILGELEKDKND